MPSQDTNFIHQQSSTQPQQPIEVKSQQAISDPLNNNIIEPKQTLILSLLTAFLLSGILLFILDLIGSLLFSAILIITVHFFFSTFISFKYNAYKIEKLLLKIHIFGTFLPIIILFIISIAQSTGCIGLGCIGPGMVLLFSFIYLVNLTIYLKLLGLIQKQLNQKIYFKRLFYIFLVIIFLALLINFTNSNFKVYTQKTITTPHWTTYQLSPYLELNRSTIEEFNNRDRGRLSNFRNGVQDDKYISYNKGYHSFGWLNDDVIIYTKEGLNNKNKIYILSKNVKTNSDKLLAELEGGFELVASPNRDQIAITSTPDTIEALRKKVSLDPVKLRLDIINIDGSKWIYGDLTTCDDYYLCPLSWTTDGLLIEKDDYHVSKITY